jgi:AmmeMemoRadiSam system protein B
VSRRVRPPAVAGSFYPAGPEGLARVVDRLLAAAEPAVPGARPEALIVPHAGYAYSGPVAATAYATLRPFVESIRRAVVIGPAHFVPLSGTAVPASEAWSTPLGEMPIDDELRTAAVGAGATVDDEPHAPEHSIEVQLPFLQRLIGPEAPVLPIAVGLAQAEDVAEVLSSLWRADGSIVLVSTDLSHYHDRETARRLDRRTAEAVVAVDPEALGPEDACGVFALRGVLALARRLGLDVRLLDLRTSADTAGDPSSVVGYGAFAIGSAAHEGRVTRRERASATRPSGSRRSVRRPGSSPGSV